jgi:cytochrome c-type biogenesis protein CcmH/NrfG
VLTRRTIELDPTNPSARYFLAMGLAESNRRDEAISELEIGLKMAPDSAPIHSLIAELFAQQGRTAEAQKHRNIAQRLMIEQAQQSGHPGHP